MDANSLSDHSGKNEINYDDKGLLSYFKSNYRGSLLTKTHEFGLFLEDLRKKNLNQYTIESASGPNNAALVRRDTEAAFSQKISLTSNNYLGLATHPRVLAACIEALHHYGSSSGGSPLLSGTLSVHKELEAELAAFLGKDDTMLYTSGYAANVGIVNALVGPSDYCVIDKLVHASIVDGLLLSRAKFSAFKHNDTDDLESKLAGIPAGSGILVIVDGVYSMEGDIAALREIVALKHKYNFVLLVDDAHAIGVIGREGRGTSDYFGVADQVDLIMGTMSKGLSGTGGFVAGEARLVQYLRYFSRSSMFSSNIPPAVAAGVLEALRILKVCGDEMIQELRTKAQFLRAALLQAGIRTKGDPMVPIINIPVGSDLLSRQLCRDLYEGGLLANAIPAPVVPKNEACVRLRVTRLHTMEQLAEAAQVVRRVFAAAHVQQDELPH